MKEPKFKVGQVVFRVERYRIIVYEVIEVKPDTHSALSDKYRYMLYNHTDRVESYGYYDVSNDFYTELSKAQKAFYREAQRYLLRVEELVEELEEKGNLTLDEKKLNERTN